MMHVSGNTKFIVYLLFAFFVWYHPAMAVQLKVCTFNIRYDSGIDGINSWVNRKSLMLNYLKKQKTDIICLQEVLHHQYVYLLNGLDKYVGVGAGRNDGQTKGEYAPIFFMKKKFELLDSGVFWLSEVPKKVGSVGWDAKQPRIVIWTILKIKKTGEYLVLFNTHLDNIGKRARIESVNLIMDRISNYSAPVILAGDFNDSPQSKLYQIITGGQSGMVDTDNSAHRKQGISYTFHDFGKIQKTKRNKIDYIFVKGFKTIKKSVIPLEKQIKNVFLSDHNPILVTLIL